jgi:trans-2,3-dihydro-3-hydroxyanthranilate isomerase
VRAYVVADVFTDVPLQGNPVAVFLDGTGLGDELMQRTARELNLSETVFLTAGEQGVDARARIFTPTMELPFAGHPVLGSAFVLASRRGLDQVRLATGSGVIAVKLRRSGGEPVFGEMEQPIPTWSAFERAPELLAALGVQQAQLPVELYDNGSRHAFVALRSDDEVGTLAPDLNALARVGKIGASCFHARADGSVKTRMFGPALGVAEDPATGSAAGPLAVHLARHGVTSFGQRLEISQGTEIGRSSVLHACIEGSPDRIERVLVGGGAVIVAHGEYRLD